MLEPSRRSDFLRNSRVKQRRCWLRGLAITEIDSPHLRANIDSPPTWPGLIRAPFPCLRLSMKGRLLVEVRVAAVASRRYEPERIPTLLARPQGLDAPGLGPISPSRHLMDVGRPTRGTLLLRASRDGLWHGYFPFGPRRVHLDSGGGDGGRSSTRRASSISLSRNGDESSSRAPRLTFFLRNCWMVV